jgi:tetratricopeptide (TPR) repeat protein
MDAFDFREALALADAALARRTQLAPRLVLSLLADRARCVEVVDTREAHRRALEAVRDFAGACDLPVPAAALDAHGRLLLARGETERAERFFRQQLDAAVAGADRVGEARARRNLAAAVLRTGEVQRARDLLERALLLARTEGHRAEERAVTAALADVLEATGAVERAAEHHARSLDLAIGLGDVPAACRAHAALARLSLRRGRAREAQVHLDRQLHRARAAGDRRAECEAQRGWARLALARGELGLAHAALAEARRLVPESLRNPDLAGLYADLAHACMLQGDPAGLLRHATRALSMAQRGGDPEAEVAALTWVGRAAEERDDPGEAVAWYEQAIESAQAAGLEAAVLGARLGLARGLRRSGREAPAADARAAAAEAAAAQDLPGARLVAEAMRAAAGEASAARVRADLVRWGDRLTVHERIEVLLELSAATGDGLCLVEARELLDDMAAALGDRPVADLAAGHSLYRRVRSARADGADVLGIGA